MAAATQDTIATASVTATMANHMSTSTIDDEQTRRLTVPCLGHKEAESGHASATTAPPGMLRRKGEVLKLISSRSAFAQRSSAIQAQSIRPASNQDTVRKNDELRRRIK